MSAIDDIIDGQLRPSLDPCRAVPHRGSMLYRAQSGQNKLECICHYLRGGHSQLESASFLSPLLLAEFIALSVVVLSVSNSKFWGEKENQNQYSMCSLNHAMFAIIFFRKVKRFTDLSI